MAARSGLRNSVPTSGSCPPGRNSSEVAGNCRNRSSLPAVCDRKVSSTTKPCRARRVAGCSASASEIVPNSSSARSQVSGSARCADRQPARLHRGEGQGSAARVLQGPGAHGQRRRLAAVDARDLAGLGVVVEEEAAAAHARRVGLGDAERGGRGHRRVGGVAAAAQDAQAGRRGVGVDGRDGAAGADRERLLGDDDLRDAGGCARDEHPRRESGQGEKGGAACRHAVSSGAGRDRNVRLCTDTTAQAPRTRSGAAAARRPRAAPRCAPRPSR